MARTLVTLSRSRLWGRSPLISQKPVLASLRITTIQSLTLLLGDIDMRLFERALAWRESRTAARNSIQKLLPVWTHFFVISSADRNRN